MEIDEAIMKTLIKECIKNNLELNVTRYYDHDGTSAILQLIDGEVIDEVWIE